MSVVPQRLSAALLTVVVAVCIYRARTQSFTVDESWVFNSFVNQKLAVMGHTYDACNHVLHTVFMKLSRHFLGSGELALRVPGLVGALIYCIAIYKLTRLLLSGWTQLLAVALLTLHPLILDFLIAARGYGLALALFVSALYCAIAYHVRGFDQKWMRWAGILAGLSIGANLVMLIPVTALGIGLLLLALRNGARSWWMVLDSYGGPALVTAFMILVIPLLSARREHFYYGEDSLFGFVQSLVVSHIKVPGRWPAALFEWLTPALVTVIVPMLLVVCAGACIHCLVVYLRTTGAAPYRLAPLVLVSGTLVFSAILLLCLHLIIGMKYPIGRTGLYLIPLFFLTLLLGIRLLDERRWVWLRGSVHGLGALAVVMFLVQTDNRFFEDWEYDAGTGRLLRTLHEDFARRVQPGQDPATLGTSLFVNQTVNYYRVRRRMDWLASPESGKLDSHKYDYYLLYGDDLALVDRLHLNLIAKDPVSGEALARGAE